MRRWLLIAELGSQARRFFPPSHPSLFFNYFMPPVRLYHSEDVVVSFVVPAVVLVREHNVEDHLVDAGDQARLITGLDQLTSLVIS